MTTMEIGASSDISTHPPGRREKTQALQKAVMCFGVLAHHSAQDVKNLLKSLEQDQELSTGFPFEILLVDNASNDAVSRELRQITRQSWLPIRHIRREKNSLAEARNQVLAMSQCEFVGFFDSDVEIPKGWMVRALQALQTHETWAGVSGPGQMLSAHSSWHRRWQELTRHPWVHLSSAQNKPVADSSQGQCDHLPCSAVLFRKQAMEDLGGFPPERQFAGEDLELGLRLVQKGWQLRLLPELTFLHYQSASTLADWRRRCVKLAWGRAGVSKALPREWRKPLVVLPALWGIVALGFLLTMVASAVSLLGPSTPEAQFFFFLSGGALFLQHAILPMLLSLRYWHDLINPREWVLRSVLLWNCQASYAWGFYLGLLGRVPASFSEASEAKGKAVKGKGVDLNLRPDVFSASQVASKNQLIEILKKHSGQRVFPRVYVLAGWVGIFPFLLRVKGDELFEQVILVDADPAVCQQSRLINDLLCQEGRFRAVAGDVNRDANLYMQMQAGDLVVNSSLEHFTEMTWLRQIPKGCVVLLQGADLIHPEHVRLFSKVDEIREVLKEQGLEFEEWYSDVRTVPAGSSEFHRVTWMGILR